MRFGQYLRDVRKAKGLSQRALAAQIGVDFTYLSKIEQGRMAPPSESVIRHIAQVLKVDVNELLNLSGKVPPTLKAELQSNPLAVELVRILSERRLPDEVYQQMLDLALKETR